MNLNVVSMSAGPMAIGVIPPSQHVHTHTYIYEYIYIYRERVRERHISHLALPREDEFKGSVDVGRPHCDWRVKVGGNHAREVPLLEL